MRAFTRFLNRSTGAAVLLAALAAAPALTAFADETPPPVVTTAFDGVWEVSVNPDAAATQAGKQLFTDLVLFENGKLTASACAQYGFAPSAFTVDGSSFATAMTSEHGTIAWSASMANGRLSGTVVWSRPDGSVDRYSLSGQRYVDQSYQEVTDAAPAAE